MKAVFQSRSTFRRVAKMRLVCRVGSCVIEHRINCGSQGVELHNSRKDRAITNLGVNHESRPLRDLERVKFGRRFANALFDFTRSRAIQ